MLMEPKCYTRNCVHFLGIISDGPEDEIDERPNCKAFPDGIPSEIAYGCNLHTELWVSKIPDGLLYKGLRVLSSYLFWLIICFP